MFRQRGASSLGDRESLSGPCPFGHARVVAFDDISGTTEFIQFPVLTTASGDSEHEEFPAMPLDALQQRDESRGQLQITHERILQGGSQVDQYMYNNGHAVNPNKSDLNRF